MPVNSSGAAIAVILARGGSKRLPGKNVRTFCGAPIISYPIREATLSGCFDEVMVSTDDPDIAEVGGRYGATTPFMRSSATSSDAATTADALLEVLDDYQKQGRQFALACCLYATAAFVTAVVLREGRQLLCADAAFDSVISVTPFAHPIERALRVEQARVTAIDPEYLLTRTQDLQPSFHDAAQFYWVHVPAFQQSRRLIGNRTGALILGPAQVQDIDTEEDWQRAEMKFVSVRR